MAGRMESRWSGNKKVLVFAAVSIIIFLLTSSFGYAQETDTTPPVILELNVSPNPFSPNGDGVDDAVTISAEASEVVEWRIFIFNSYEQDVAFFKEKSNILNVEWDGWEATLWRNASIVSNGNYTILIKAGDGYGNSAEKTVIVEVIGSPTPPSPPSPGSTGSPPPTPEPPIYEPPSISDLKVSPEIFSPNGDGIDDITTISAEASEEIRGWSISIVNVETEEAYVKMSDIRGKILSLEWDGSSDRLDYMVPDGKYMIIVYAEGEGGVTKKTTSAEVIESPNKNKVSTEEVPEEFIEEAPGDLTISNFNIPEVLRKGEVYEAVITFTNAGEVGHDLDLSVSLKPHSTAITIISDRVKFSAPAKSDVVQTLKIMPNDWAEGKRYGLVFQFKEDDRDIYYRSLPIQISEEIKKPTASITSATLVVVRSDLLVDFVSAQSYAKPNGAPVIQVDPKGLTEEDLSQVNNYIQSGIKKAVIVGGPVAISIINEIKLQEMGLEVERIGGADRYETASMVAMLWNKADAAVIANGEDETSYMEALQRAVADKVPLLLSRSEYLPNSTLQTIQALGVKKVILGPGIGDSVINDMEELAVEIE